MELEVRHLRVLCTIAETGSLTRAAAALRLSQPGLSNQLRRIEKLLGGELFERTANGVVPTPLGRMVLTRARAVLPTVDELMSSTTFAAQSGFDQRTFRLGSVNAPLIGGLIDALRSLFPAAEITTRAEGSPFPLVDDVAAGRLDAAVVGDSPGYELPLRSSVVLHPIATEPVFALLPESHRLAGNGEVSLAELADEEWVLPRPDNDRTREYWASAFVIGGHRMRVPYEAEGRLVVEIVRSGAAVSLCQATFDEVPGVVVRPISATPLWYRHVLAWHRDGAVASHAPVLIRYAEDAYSAALARSRAYGGWLANR